jgi:hypothetical protein
MPYVGFETTIPAYERAKTVHALDSSATVTVLTLIGLNKLILSTLRFIYFLLIYLSSLLRLFVSFLHPRAPSRLLV